MRNEPNFTPAGRAPVAVILGTNDVASAVGLAFHAAGYGVVLSQDPTQPVLRRGMAFDDALSEGDAMLDGVKGVGVDSLVEIVTSFHDRRHVSVTKMDIGDLICLGLIDVLVDARLRMHALKVDIRPFARVTVGLGPGFNAGRNVDAAVETAPEATGRVFRAGGTLAAHGRSALLGGAGRERFGRAPTRGVWRTSAVLGDRVTRGDLIGMCGGEPVTAPMAGRIRGLVRGEAEVMEGTKLVEVDPRADAGASWTGVSDRARVIAAAALEAVALVETWQSATDASSVATSPPPAH